MTAYWLSGLSFFAACAGGAATQQAVNAATATPSARLLTLSPSSSWQPVSPEPAIFRYPITGWAKRQRVRRIGRRSDPVAARLRCRLNGLRDAPLRAADGVATIALDQPETRNALSDQLLDELIAAFGVARDDADVRCVVLTSTHDKVFSSGGDLTGFAADVP